MSAVSGFTEPAIKLLEVATIIGRWGTLIALLIGSIGWWGYAKDARAMARFRGMAVGGGAGYMAIVAIDIIYDILVFILGSQFLPAGWPYGAVTGTHASNLSQFATALSIVLHSFGLVLFIIGVTWWAFGSRDSSAESRGRRGILMGLTLIGGSIGGNVVSVFAWILL
jgi:cbb3-type cytochrome oxidase subunit 3